ncbi:MAG: hypothetical protein GY915_06420 [bacterium]|nr:hypothetical protein [bacterium]
MTSIRISDEIVSQAQVYGKVYNRSAPKQIEFWSRIGKIAEENPDLTYENIKEILLALEEKRLGDLEEYSFNS